jgi:branched-subunit amino acid transport protein
MTAIVALTLLAAGTWLLRVVFITMLHPAALPAPVRATLDFVAPAALAGLVVTVLSGGDGVSGLRLSLAEAVALIAAAVVALRGGTLLLTIGAGLLVLWTGQLLAGI